MQAQDNTQGQIQSTLINTRPRVVGEWIEEHEIATLCARPGIGKSPLLWDWCVSTATGRQWHGDSRLTHPALVTFIDTQSSPHRIRDHMRAILQRRTGSEAWPDTLIVNNERITSVDDFARKYVRIQPAMEVQAHLIVVDNALSYFSFVNTSTYQDCAKWLDGLRQAIQEVPVPTSILLSHTIRMNPSYRPNDIMRDIRTWISHTVSLGITAEPDVRLGIEFAPGSEDVIVLNGVARGRRITPSMWQIASLPDERMAGFELSEYVIDVRQLGYTQQQHELMRKLPVNGFTTRDLQQEARQIGISERGARYFIERLLATRLCERVAHGVYRFVRM